MTSSSSFSIQQQQNHQNTNNISSPDNNSEMTTTKLSSETASTKTNRLLSSSATVEVEDGGGVSTTTPPPPTTTPPLSLTRREKIDVILLVLSFSCVVASLTLIVGTGAVVMYSVGGSTTIAPFALGCFFLGMAFVSLIFTHWIFQLQLWSSWMGRGGGRTIGFWIGCSLRTVGSGIAIGGLFLSSPTIILIANVILGGGSGIAMYLRFAAVEVVPNGFATKIVTWTLCGGCLAAFVGPELAALTKGMFSQTEGDNLTYLGVFIIAAVFAMLEAILVGFIRFDNNKSNNTQQKLQDDESRDVEKPRQSDQIEDDNGMESKDRDDRIQLDDDVDSKDPSPTTLPCDISTTLSLRSLLLQSSFVIPVLISILSWAIMAMPMSIFRVNMREIGYSDRQSLTVIELHFLAMYMPGFWSGSMIGRFGYVRGTLIACGCFVIATAINLSSPNNTQTTATWFLGLIFLGIGWNFGFSSATVAVQRVYSKEPHLHLYKAKVQAANEFFTFLVSGGLIFSTGYINGAGGGGITGWRLLNAAVGVLTVIMIIVVCIAAKYERIDKQDQAARNKMGQTVQSEDC